MTETTATPAPPPGRVVHPDTLRDMLRLGASTIEPIPFHGDMPEEPDAFTAVVPEGFKVAVTDMRPYKKQPAAPRRVTGNITVTDLVSWIAYYDKHETPGAEIFGDVKQSRITALLNAPEGPDDPQWADHRLILQLEHSPAWLAWTALSGRLLSQDQFAEHIEDRTPDLIEPDAATMLEVAQSIQATNQVNFESRSRLHDGARVFSYREDVQGQAGQRGDLYIPTEIRLRLPVWRGRRRRGRADRPLPLPDLAAEGLKVGIVHGPPRRPARRRLVQPARRAGGDRHHPGAGRPGAVVRHQLTDPHDPCSTDSPGDTHAHLVSR
jgi:uncharacterized protein YfdQ (DUF2303 family)